MSLPCDSHVLATGAVTAINVCSVCREVYIMLRRHICRIVIECLSSLDDINVAQDY